MDHNEELKKQFRIFASNISELQAMISQSISPVEATLSMIQKELNSSAVMVSTFAAEMNRQWSDQIAPVIQMMLANNRANLSFDMPPDLAKSVLELPRKIEKIIPQYEGESSIDASITIRQKVEADRFTWRDALTLIDILISLLALIAAYSSQSDSPEINEIRQEIEYNIDQSANYFINNYYINFPDDQPIISEDLQDVERLDSDH